MDPTFIGTRYLYKYVELARTIYIRRIYGVFGREMTRYTVIYGAYIRFWPTLCICISESVASIFVKSAFGLLLSACSKTKHPLQIISSRLF